MMTTFTLMFALVLGVAGVRTFQSGTTVIEIDSSYFNLLDQTAPKSSETVITVKAPEMRFEEIIIPQIGRAHV